MDLTILMLSCRRLHLLVPTLEGARRHFAEVEPDVRASWVCFDNGSSSEDRAVLARLGFDILLLSSKNLGQGPALNHLLTTVRTEHFLLLEDDWFVENPDRVRFFEESAAILASDRNLASVKLDGFYFTDFTDRARYDGPFTVEGRSVRYYVQNPAEIWGGMCFPPSVTLTEAVRRVGPIREDQPFRRWWAESEYSARFARQYFVAKSPGMLAFKHAGATEPCPVWGELAAPA